MCCHSCKLSAASFCPTNEFVLRSWPWSNQRHECRDAMQQQGTHSIMFCNRIISHTLHITGLLLINVNIVQSHCRTGRMNRTTGMMLQPPQATRPLCIGAQWVWRAKEAPGPTCLAWRLWYSMNMPRSKKFLCSDSPWSHRRLPCSTNEITAK